MEGVINIPKFHGMEVSPGVTLIGEPTPLMVEVVLNLRHICSWTIIDDDGIAENLPSVPGVIK